jgi:glycosyltransferase involved in cell wall biosynthesis
MIKFSIIIPTINRKKAVSALLYSIAKLNYFDYEIIIVDQNHNGLIDDICEKYAGENFKHLKVDFRGAARARNYGYKFSKGDIVVFPDDDSEMTENLLSAAEKKFQIDDIDFLFGRVEDKTAKSDVVFERTIVAVTFQNMFHTTSECTMFIRRKVFKELNGFDETLGVGTYYGADEGADFFLRAMYKDYKLVYDPQLIFNHPQKVKNNYGAETRRAYTYGRGFGRLVFKHVVKYQKYRMLLLFMRFQIRATGGIVVGVLRMNLGQVKYYVELIRGRWVGIINTAKEYFLQGKKL